MKKNYFSIFRNILSGVLYSLMISLPDELSRFRINYYNKRGCKIHKRVVISPNVRIVGVLKIDEGSSIAQNCSISGFSAGVYIGKNVMIAPNVVIVAFNHGFNDLEKPMTLQQNIEKPIFIEDNVWISANCTIGKGVRIGEGSIIGANSFVNKDIPPYSIVGGVPARIIRYRK
jgi:acetyltransferase-like isoleucine patch superfamily enzyme